MGTGMRPIHARPWTALTAGADAAQSSLRVWDPALSRVSWPSAWELATNLH
ncbi:hypothetical protein [Streptomyces sp. NPDC059783]|uniref:hypothetical protein n=1 Tax=Streptomyces sp. NPDC059783 TaxID=3346944 RepID=UPI0036692E7D